MENNVKNNNKAIILIVVFFLGCLVMYGIIHFYPSILGQNITKLEKDVTVTENGIADAVDKVYDAVVIVTTYQKENISSAGTGFIYKKNNNKYYVLTNYHVIENCDKVNVTFTNEEIIVTKIVGYNEYSDIAVLSFESKKEYKVAELGKSNDARVGDTTFAVGAPLNNAYSWTVTRGILSGKDRMVEIALNNSQTSDYVMKVLQTDTAINSGNSGGPLCNSNGQVIGITSLKLVSNGVEGMGFAIPIETALENAERIISGDTFVAPYLGISMLDLTSAYYYQQFHDNIQKSNVSGGVVVTGVEKNSPAEDGGIQAGDIIVAIDGEEVTNIAYLRYNLYTHKIGDKIKVTLYRDGNKKDVEVKLGSSAKMS